MKPEPKHSPTHVNGMAPESQSMKKTQSAWSLVLEQSRIYLIMLLGLTLVLFSMGYFPIIKKIIGVAGAALILWGAVYSGLLLVVTSWINKALSYLTKK